MTDDPRNPRPDAPSAHEPARETRRLRVVGDSDAQREEEDGGRQEGADAAATSGSDVEERVLRLLRDDLDLDVGRDTDVIETGLLDSLVFVELVVKLEREFGITVSVEDLELDDFRSARQIARTLRRHPETV